MKRTLLVVFLFLSSFLFFQSLKAETWYSQGLADPTDVHNWTYFRDGGFFCSNFSTPGDIFVVQPGGDVNITTSWGVTGAGAKLQIESGAALMATGPVTIGSSTTFQIDNGGRYIHNNTSAFASTILQGTESFAAGSTFEFWNWAGVGPAAGITWGNVVFNALNPSVDLQWDDHLVTVLGNLDVKNTGTKRVILTTQFMYDLSISGDLTISGGTLELANIPAGFSAPNVYLYGNFNMSGGTLTKTAPEESDFFFQGANKTYSKTGGTISFGNTYWVVNDNASITLLTNFPLSNAPYLSIEGTLDFGSYQITGGGGFACNTEGNVKTSHPQGLIGNLANSGDKHFSQCGIDWNGTGDQSLGLSGTSTSSIRYFNISNTTGIVTADANFEVDHSSYMNVSAGGVLDMKNFTILVYINGGVNIAGTLKTSNPNGLNGGANTTVRSNNDPWVNLAPGSKIEYNSNTSRQVITPRNDYKSLAISGDSVKSFTDAVTVADSFIVSDGAIVLLDTNTLTGSGDSALFGGTGSISLNSLTQVTGFDNNFGGHFYVIGSNTSIPSGNYNELTIDGIAHQTGNVTVENLTLVGTLTVGHYNLNLSNPIFFSPENLITDSTSRLGLIGNTDFTIPTSVTRLGALIINNISAGGVILNHNLDIDGILTLFDGQLHIGSNTLTVDSTQSGSIDSYVQMDSIGRLKINNVDGYAYFHVGSTSYNPCVINNTGGTPDNFSVGIRNTITNPLSDNNQAVQREWNISEDVPGGSNAYITLQWITSEQGFSVNHAVLKIGHYINGGYDAITCSPVGGSNPTWTITTSIPVTTFSPFIIANDGVAPVELASFTSMTNRNNVNLKWSTVSEENNSGFDIERKSGKAEWIKITNVQGHGTSNNSHSYSFEDRNLQTGKYNYRLKQIDYNGNFKYYDLSNEVIVGVPSKFDLSQNYPNPFNPSTSINYELPITNYVSLKIFDIAGREVLQLVNEIKEAGYYTVKFDASKLSSGIYFYNIQAGNFIATKKMMLVK